MSDLDKGTQPCLNNGSSTACANSNVERKHCFSQHLLKPRETHLLILTPELHMAITHLGFDARHLFSE